MTERISSLDQILSHVKSLIIGNRKPRAAILGGKDEHVLEAVTRADKGGLIDSLNIENGESIEQAIGICSEKFKKKEIDFILIGNYEKLTTNKNLYDVLSILIPPGKFINHVAVFEAPGYPGFLLMSDGFINVAPDIKGKLALITNAVKLSKILGISRPKVALLAAVEVVYPGMRVTEESAEIAAMFDKGEIEGCLVDGPLSFDVATVPDIARQKGKISEVAGRADILIAPNIETGNGIYKAMSVFVKSKIAGVIMGGEIPIAVSSQCDSSENVFYSLLLGAFMTLDKTVK